MNEFGRTVSLLDYLAANKRRRHLAGGILLSISLLFGGLAITMMTVKPEDIYVD